MNIIILDQHSVNDDRINRHIKLLLSCKYTVVRLQVNRYDPNLKEGIFSLFGETGYRINESLHAIRFVRSIYFNMVFCLTPLIFLRVRQFFKRFPDNESPPTIIHVHDAVFLNLAILLKKYRYPQAKIVYDRHELYEYKIKKFGISIPRIPRCYEILFMHGIDGVVSVSRHHNDTIHKLFPHALISVVPNFPQISEYNTTTITDKIEQYDESSELNLIYIGSLDDDFDRDIKLLLKIADTVLQKFPRTLFQIGGDCNNPELKNKFALLGKKYPGRFFFLGYITRHKTVRITEKAHIGFFLLKPSTSYWVTCSPNKIFEYLLCGVIPVIRANVDYSDDFGPASMVFDRFAPEREILASVEYLIENPEKCRQMMHDAYQLGQKFTFDAVGHNYIQVYNELLSG